MKTQVKVLLNAEPVLPGTLENRYNICGKAGCRCKDKVNPRKHGPYYRLSYSIKGKNSSVFVPAEDAIAVARMTENYREARSNTQELALEMVELYRQEGLHGMLNNYRRQVEQEGSKKSGMKPESAVLREVHSSRDKWKSNALARGEVLEKNRIEIRDLKKSRENWKHKAFMAQGRATKLQKKIKDMENIMRRTEKCDTSKKKSMWQMKMN